MGDIASVVRGLNRNQQLRLTDPDVGEITVMIPEPRETADVTPGVKHFVFTHASGRMIGLNWEVPDDSDDTWEECTLVADADRWQHVLILRGNGEVHLLTRREPGEPDDWEDRGMVNEIVEVETEAS